MGIIATQNPIWIGFANLTGLARLLQRRVMRATDRLYVHMFLEDCGHLVPYRDRRGGKAFFKLSTNDEDFALEFLGAFDDRYRRRIAAREIDDSMRQLMENVVYRLLVHGRALFHVRLGQGRRGDTEVGIIDLDPSYIFRILGLTFQLVPPREARWDSDGVPSGWRLLRLDNAALIKLALPGKLRRLCRGVIRRLAVLSKLSFPDVEKLWERPTLENPNPKSGPMDFTQFRANFEIALFRSIRETGWTARDHSGEKQSDFFTCINRLRFKRFQAAIRDSILRQLNAQIAKVARWMRPGFELEIEGEGLLGIAELVELERALYAGEISFKNLIDRTYNE